jgi:hypothetical protein
VSLLWKKTNVYEWHKRFQYGREDVEDDVLSSGRPSMSITDENMKKVVKNDRRITIREICISIGSCHYIFSNVLGMERVAAKFVIFGKKQHRSHAPQHPYSLDMVPCDFFLFPKMKKTLKGRRFTRLD